MRWSARWWLAALSLILVGCSDGEEGTGSPPTEAAACDPTCGPCQSCDTSGSIPICVDNCAAGLSCQDSQCVGASEVACTPICGGCEMCDTSGASPVCVDLCATGTSCNAGACVPDATPSCDPACGPCQSCDTSGAAPVCVDNCASGLTCQDSQCVPPPEVECDPACGPCQMCDTSGTDPVCVDLCGVGTSCDNGACVTVDACNGTCASCQVCDTAHGAPTCVDDCLAGHTCDATNDVCRPGGGGVAFDHSGLPQLQGPFTVDVAGGKAVTAECLNCHAEAGQQMLGSAHFRWLGKTPDLQGHETGETVGKRNLVNNFCVAVPSNEQRCTQCHTGYGWVDDTFDFNDVGNVDCLSCHSTQYKKHKTTGGGPDSTVDMGLAAQNVGRPTRGTCGRCHFSAGGGDNVKKGDLGSALAAPTPDVDVHMGNATGGFQCADCHVASRHQIPGQGAHLPVSEGRLGCTDCHGPMPHSDPVANNHAQDIACQTCHVPAFSRQLPTKMDWDWSTAGNRDRGTAGVETGTLPDGTTVTVYDAMKGDFVWEKNVRPEYAWFNGRVTRMVLEDTFPAGAGTQADPIVLGSPTATLLDLDAKIFPFKVMRGQQPVDTTDRKVLAPKLFGPGGFWPAIPAAYDAQVVEDNWTAALTAGARVAGQIGPTDAFTGRATGAKPWDWAYTEMWMGINHEVAPKDQSLSCADCHFGATEWDWTALGYACDPAADDPATCGSRHP